MAKKINFFKIIHHYRFKLSGTLSLLILENIAFLMLPLLIGQAIDGAINHNYTPLWIMIFAYSFSVAIGTIRRMVDTRIYSDMHLKIAENILYQPNINNPAQQIAHIELTTDIMETINEDIPMFLESLIQIIGAFIILAQFEISYFIASLMVCTLIVVIYLFSTRTIYRLNKDLNNNYEAYINSIALNKKKSFSKFFLRMNKRKIQLSDIESRIYATLCMGTLGFLVFVLLREVKQDYITAGDIFAVLAYVMQFEEGIGELPYLYQKVIGTQEILQRFNKD